MLTIPNTSAAREYPPHVSWNAADLDVVTPISRIAVSCAITPPDYAGAGLSAFKLAERLHRRGRLAFVLTRTQVEGNGRRTFSEREGLPVIPEDRVVRVAPERRKEECTEGLLWNALLFTSETIALVASTTWQLIRRRQTYDIIHCFTPNWLSFYAILVSKLLGKQAILEATLAGRDDPQAQPSRDLLRIKNAARKLQYRLTDRIIAISPALGARFAEAGYGSKLQVITRSVDIRRFRPTNQEEQVCLRRELGLKGEGPILLFVGQIGERKGADLLIPIFARVVEKHPATRLVVVGHAGETAEQKEFHAQILADIEQHGLGAHVHFVSRTGAIEQYMQAATLFVFPSRREGFGTVVVEAMACGTIPIAFRIPGITDHMIAQGENGVYVEEEDPDAFARAILTLLADPARLQRMAAAAVRTARQRFSTEVVDSAYATLYARLNGIRVGNREQLPNQECSYANQGTTQ